MPDQERLDRIYGRSPNPHGLQFLIDVVIAYLGTA